MPGLREQLAQRVREEGFAAHGVCSPDAALGAAPRLRAWLEAGAHGSMKWMEDRADWRADPRRLWPEVRSVLVVADVHAPPPEPGKGRARIAAYARQHDYHVAVKKRLKRVARWLAVAGGAEVKVLVDTAPVMEKPLAEAAGIGWQGKHTNLVSRELGSWFVLGVVFTSALLPFDAAHEDRCGNCRRCLDVCPTAAFPSPYRLDARRCISYLTIERKEPIPRAMRPLIGERVFGCDDCLAACPWNRFAMKARACGASDAPPELLELARLDDAEFRKRFRGTPMRRTGRNRFVRNVLVALGNRGGRDALAEVERLLADEAPQVRGAAVWALSRLTGLAGYRKRMGESLPNEGDSVVAREWREGLAELARADQASAARCFGRRCGDGALENPDHRERRRQPSHPDCRGVSR